MHKKTYPCINKSICLFVCLLSVSLSLSVFAHVCMACMHIWHVCVYIYIHMKTVTRYILTRAHMLKLLERDSCTCILHVCITHTYTHISISVSVSVSVYIYIYM